MATPMHLRRVPVVLGAAYAGLLFYFERMRVPRVLAPTGAPVLRRGHRARQGAFWAAGVAAIGAALVVAALPAQAQFVSLTGFGDSYADTGAAPGGAFRLIGVSPYWPCTYPLASCRFTGSTNFVDSLQSIYGLPGLTNYSIGGARTSDSNTLGPLANSYGLPYELEQFAASGTRFTGRELIALSIGGNDMSGIDLTGHPDQTAYIVASAAGSAQRAAAGVEQLAAAGARNIAWLSTGSSKWFPERTLSANKVDFTNAQRDAWADTYYQQTQQLLAPLAQSGVRIFLFNFGILQERVAADPGRYGFTSATNCEAGPANPGVTPLTVNVNYAGCFYENSVHPTGQAMALIAAYMANQIDAPTTVVPQGSIATSLARGFSTSVLGRLDAQRSLPVPGEGFKGGGPESGWSVYSDVSYGGGNLERQFYAAGYDYDAVGGMVGAEYRVNPRLLFGGVFGYSNSTVSLGVQNARDRIDSYQFAGYGSFTGARLFADALVAYGYHGYSLDRDGVIDTVHGSTGADTFTAAAKAGYLFNAAPVRAGPIGGLNYTGGVIQGYTETGDSLLTWMVNRQTLDSLTGDAGIQIRLPFEFRGTLYSPFIDVTAEHYFPGSARTVTATLVSAPLLPVLTPVSGEAGTYGKAAAGVAARISGNVSATFNAETTFAHEGGNGLAVNGGIKVGF
jgi:outer membrane lipase/esterase